MHFIPFLQDLIVGGHNDFEEAQFWRDIANGAYVPKDARESSIRSPIFRLLHRLISTSVTHRQGSERVPTTDLFYLWCLITPGRHLNLPHALATYLARRAGGTRSASPIGGGHFITRLAESFSVFTPGVRQGMMSYDLKIIGLRELEVMRVVERGPDMIVRIPVDDPAALAQEDAPMPAPPRRHRRRAVSPAAQAGPEPEIDLRYLAERMDRMQVVQQGMQEVQQGMQVAQQGIQVQTQWIGNTLSSFYAQQGFQPLYPFPSPYAPYPEWYMPHPQQGDGAGTSGPQQQDDDEE